MIQLDNGINHKPQTKCGHVQLIKLYLRQIEDRVKDTDESTYVFIVISCLGILF
jgi:hypothetical protein